MVIAKVFIGVRERETKVQITTPMRTRLIACSHKEYSGHSRSTYSTWSSLKMPPSNKPHAPHTRGTWEGRERCYCTHNQGSHVLMPHEEVGTVLPFTLEGEIISPEVSMHVHSWHARNLLLSSPSPEPAHTELIHVCKST